VLSRDGLPEPVRAEAGVYAPQVIAGQVDMLPADQCEVGEQCFRDRLVATILGRAATAIDSKFTQVAIESGCAPPWGCRRASDRPAGATTKRTAAGPRLGFSERPDRAE
jgi:hypothetical protein